MNWIGHCVVGLVNPEYTEDDHIIAVRCYPLRRKIPVCDISFSVHYLQHPVHIFICGYIKSLLTYFRLQNIHVTVTKGIHTLISRIENHTDHPCYLYQVIKEIKKHINNDTVQTLTSISKSVVFERLNTFSDIKTLGLPREIYDSYYILQPPEFMFLEFQPLWLNSVRLVAARAFTVTNFGPRCCFYSAPSELTFMLQDFVKTISQTLQRAKNAENGNERLAIRRYVKCCNISPCKFRRHLHNIILYHQ